MPWPAHLSRVQILPWSGGGTALPPAGRVGPPSLSSGNPVFPEGSGDSFSWPPSLPISLVEPCAVNRTTFLWCGECFWSECEVWALMVRLLTQACTLPCSEVFGSQLDIHTGGIDLAFPHHENEIAQSEVFHQCPQWGNYFLHSGKRGLRHTYFPILPTLCVGNTQIRRQSGRRA